MEKVFILGRDSEQVELPPGFRFHPTDEELITHYLSPKVLDSSFAAGAIGEVDLNKVEPWDLPWKAKMGEREWYFFCIKDRKYPTGLRANRATEAGYWKATGKDKEIFKVKTLVGMKKTLVFYKGRAPKGENSNWVMHEYRLEGKSCAQNLQKSAKNEWVIFRVFRKSSAGKKTHISAMIRSNVYKDELQSSTLPPLMDLSCSYDGNKRVTVTGSQTSHLTCFSDYLEDHKPQNSHFLPSSSSCQFPKFTAPNSFFEPYIRNMHYTDSAFMQDHSILGLLLENDGPKMKDNSKAEQSQDTAMSSDISIISHHDTIQRSNMDQQYTITSSEHVNLDCMWNY